MSKPSLIEKFTRATACAGQIIPVAVTVGLALGFQAYLSVMEKLGLDKSPLTKAIEAWDADKVEALLKQGVDTNKAGAALGKFPAIATAVGVFVKLDDKARETGAPVPSTRIIEVLMREKNVNLEVIRGLRPDGTVTYESIADWVIARGNLRAIEAMVDNGFPVDRRIGQSHSALVESFIPAKNDRRDDNHQELLAIFYKILEASEGVNDNISYMMDLQDGNPADYIYTLVHAIAEHNESHTLEIAKAMIEKGAWKSLNVRAGMPMHESGFSTMNFHGRRHSPEITVTQRVTRDEHHGMTPLEIAFYEGHEDMANLLATAMVEHDFPLPTEEECRRLRTLKQELGDGHQLLEEQQFAMTEEDGTPLEEPRPILPQGQKPPSLT